jgi:hypothetical protein
MLQQPLEFTLAAAIRMVQQTRDGRRAAMALAHTWCRPSSGGSIGQ